MSTTTRPGRGGARPGAGRPKKEQPKPSGIIYADAESYLAAVVEGREMPDQLRIAAAKALMAYQKPKQRAPVASPPPRTLAAQAMTAAGKSAAEDFGKKAAAIRAKHERK